MGYYNGAVRRECTKTEKCKLTITVAQNALQSPKNSIEVADIQIQGIVVC